MPTSSLFPQRLVPVVILDDPARADGLASALVDGGLPVAEVTLRTPSALKALEAMARRDDLLVGAGTVVSVEQVSQVIDAGARFIVSPGLDAEVVAAAQRAGVPIFPGVVTPSEVMAAMKLGLGQLKFFPAGNYGGAATLKAFASPFGKASFIPTGGVSEANLGDYLSLPNVVAVGGSWMVPAKQVAAGEFEQVRELVAGAVSAAAAFAEEA